MGRPPRQAATAANKTTMKGTIRRMSIALLLLTGLALPGPVSTNQGVRPPLESLGQVFQMLGGHSDVLECLVDVVDIVVQRPVELVHDRRGGEERLPQFRDGTPQILPVFKHHRVDKSQSVISPRLR